MVDIKISIIVPVYNMEKLLSKCLNSLSAIAIDAIEFILVNDGSTDNSEMICQDFTKKDKRFVYKLKPNGGVSSARNYGYSFASGKYIAYVDSDDYVDPEAWSKLYDIAEAHQVDILNFGHHYVNGVTIDHRTSGLPKDAVLTHDDILKVLRTRYNLSSFLWFPWSNFFRKSLLDKYQMEYKEEVQHGMEDTLFILESYLKAQRIYSISTPCYYYVHYSDSLTQKKRKKFWLSSVELQFKERRKLYKEFKIESEPHLLHMSRHYLEHTLFAGLINAKNAKEGECLEEVSAMRDSEVYEYSFRHYKSSRFCTTKMKLIIYLFKYRMFKLMMKIY